MSESSHNYPKPHCDADNQPMLEAWRDGRLVLPRCQSCERLFFYPRPLCPHCWSDRIEWREVSGRGTVVSFSLVRRPNDPAFIELPIVLAEIRLDEGPSMLSRIVHAPPEAVVIGMLVQVISPPATKRFPLPTFQPEQ